MGRWSMKGYESIRNLSRGRYTIVILSYSLKSKKEECKSMKYIKGGVNWNRKRRE